MKTRSLGRAGTELRHRKIRIETVGRDGQKLSITLEGVATREKFRQLFELVELLTGGEDFEEGLLQTKFRNPELLSSKFDRVEFIIGDRFNTGPFSSPEIRESYEEIFGESIPLNVISTYLTRLCERGVLSRASNGGRIEYRVIQKSLRLPTLRLTS